MTDFEAYQEYIQRKHNAFCKAVIRYAARDKILHMLPAIRFCNFAGNGSGKFPSTI